MNEKKASIRNIAIFAHVDAGKTTITEQLLYSSGAIAAPGRVDHGNTVSDDMDIEKERGISVQAATVSFTYNDITINLIDTPGHADFSAQAESALNCVDGAVLVISAVKGVQPQTKVLWRALRMLEIPNVFFINKTDRINSNTINVLAEIHRELTQDCVPYESLENECSSDVRVTSVDFSKEAFTGETERILVEAVAEKDEILFDAMCADYTVTTEAVHAALKRTFERCAVFPVLFGSAMTGAGILELLDFIARFMPSPLTDPDVPFSAIVYKVDHHSKYGKMASIKVLGGTLTVMDVITNGRTDQSEKITRIRKKTPKGLLEITSLQAGDVGMVSGLKNVIAGDRLGDGAEYGQPFTFAVPVLSVRVSVVNKAQHQVLVQALNELTSEDPHLSFRYVRETNELNVSVMGKMQIEILSDILLKRFGIEAEFAPPAVIYKETPLQEALGYVEYTMPKPCWAVMRFRILPGKRGSGVAYSSKVRTSDIAQKYQNEVERAVPYVLKQGLHGWEVTDIVIELIDGEDHEMHSRPSDFTIATHMGIMVGLKNAGTTLLEPMWAFEISAPEEFAGKILYDLTQMRGEFENPETAHGYTTIKGTVPVAAAMDYAVKLTSATGGKGSIGLTFAGYRECPLELGADRPRIGIDPLDTAKFILYARNAIQ